MTGQELAAKLRDLGFAQIKSHMTALSDGDLLEIQPDDGASWWLPFTKDAVPEVRLADGLIVAVRPEETE